MDQLVLNSGVEYRGVKDSDLSWTGHEALLRGKIVVSRDQHCAGGEQKGNSGEHHGCLVMLFVGVNNQTGKRDDSAKSQSYKRVYSALSITFSKEWGGWRGEMGRRCSRVKRRQEVRVYTHC